ncbi:MAG TPA: HEAT repeat domain-containing protein [Candidatus Treponema faecavium]|nr:HEAT repeat domain-containing protein [Candidatus Treponema faecavium]
MKISKLAAVLMISSAALSGFAQTETAEEQQSTSSDITVEDEYLSSMEDLIVTELAFAPDRDTKLVALQYLEDAVNQGSISPNMQTALNALAGEGVLSQTRENGRLVNNFPDIRARACELLGMVATEESKNLLVDIVLADNEPMVISAAIRSLGDIGMNENDEVVNTIAWAQKRNAVLNPTSSLAHEVLVAYEKLLPTIEDKSPVIQSIASIATNYRYITPVRTMAQALLKKISTSDSNSSEQQNTQQQEAAAETETPAEGM